MVFRVVLFLWEFLMDVLAVSRLSDDEKELELLLLRQQLRIVERKQERGPQIPRWQKVPLAMLAVRLKERARNGKSALEASVRLFRPTTRGWLASGHCATEMDLSTAKETGTTTD